MDQFKCNHSFYFIIFIFIYITITNCEVLYFNTSINCFEQQSPCLLSNPSNWINNTSPKNGDDLIIDFSNINYSGSDSSSSSNSNSNNSNNNSDGSNSSNDSSNDSSDDSNNKLNYIYLYINNTEINLNSLKVIGSNNEAIVSILINNTQININNQNISNISDSDIILFNNSIINIDNSTITINSNNNDSSINNFQIIQSNITLNFQSLINSSCNIQINSKSNLIIDSGSTFTALGDLSYSNDSIIQNINQSNIQLYGTVNNGTSITNCDNWVLINQSTITINIPNFIISNFSCYHNIIKNNSYNIYFYNSEPSPPPSIASLIKDTNSPFLNIISDIDLYISNSNLNLIQSNSFNSIVFLGSFGNSVKSLNLPNSNIIINSNSTLNILSSIVLKENSNDNSDSSINNSNSNISNSNNNSSLIGSILLEGTLSLEPKIYITVNKYINITNSLSVLNINYANINALVNMTAGMIQQNSVSGYTASNSSTLTKLYVSGPNSIVSIQNTMVFEQLTMRNGSTMSLTTYIDENSFHPTLYIKGNYSIEDSFINISFFLPDSEIKNTTSQYDIIVFALNGSSTVENSSSNNVNLNINANQIKLIEMDNSKKGFDYSLKIDSSSVSIVVSWHFPIWVFILIVSGGGIAALTVLGFFIYKIREYIIYKDYQVIV
ncbi:hypothetical protein DICPUDRAFT_79434 [Dictyostelium purpureum]|uniref:Uncharacterized protein n=1 Tax=Dictyostelium purpureum TaxID=5786 RepID=F0ZMK3_DICPU|nr:uncharacterized protein DICPUDRAFT_79434 [Dictyostelium purpureum]EGC34830.1 hypothetical protein DICPUDRAFT_79434 [Dictyostelium purpureum]|eukprot:XP_003288637.1 hypothetical protein DICPUDRAFT_79434 [Dictyostelium purpureum]